MKLTQYPPRDFHDPIIQAIQEINPTANNPALIYIESGHYDPRFVEDDDLDFAKESLKAGIELVTNIVIDFKNRIKVILGILIDNLGQQCGTMETCQVKPLESPQNANSIPAELERILNGYPIVKPDRVEITHERAAKNRAIERLKKLLKAGKIDEKDLIIKQEGESQKIYFNTASGQILLATKTGDVWTAQCPSIMGAHYSDLSQTLQKRFGQFPNADRFIIDFSEASDRSKVNGGAQVALRPFNSRPDINQTIINITALSDNVDDTFVDTFK